MVRFVTALPNGTPFSSAAVRELLLKYTMLRALVTATSILKTVESGMRRNPMIVPSRSATATTILVRDPIGRRIAARVVFAVASALSRICFTSAALSPPSGPAAGAIKSPSGGCPWLFVGGIRKLPVPATDPGENPAGRSEEHTSELQSPIDISYAV